MKLPKVSKMSAAELVDEAKTGCTGLRKTQVLPAIEALAMKGDQVAIKHLDRSGKQSAPHS